MIYCVYEEGWSALKSNGAFPDYHVEVIMVDSSHINPKKLELRGNSQH